MLSKYLALFASAGSAFAIGACAVLPTAEDVDDIKHTLIEFSGIANQKKSIFIFLDGTANDPRSATNVWRLFETIRNSGDPQVAGKYIEGVGSVGSPEFSSSWFGGLAFGQGMEIRIKLAYDFIAKNYRPGDDVYIFGFSRGAHQARSLAGFISYVGVPVSTDRSALFGIREWNKILEITKSKSDSEYADYWMSWEPNMAPPLSLEAREALGAEFQPIQIRMLGVWDTVPGSSFKKFGTCKELPDGKDGDRYKSDSYPAIRTIAHAVALDEKRDKFNPLLLCPAMEVQSSHHKPKTIEKWFPGAHADVGGGYDDGGNELSNISLNWMIGTLAQNYTFKVRPTPLPENPNGLAHWSIRDMPVILGMKCEDRKRPPQEALHPSASLRQGSPPVRVQGLNKRLAYPIFCKDEDKLVDVP